MNNFYILKKNIYQFLRFKKHIFGRFQTFPEGNQTEPDSKINKTQKELMSITPKIRINRTETDGPERPDLLSSVLNSKPHIA